VFQDTSLIFLINKTRI